MASRGGVGRLSLDELIALNEEIAALVRAGVPIERGLAGAGRDLGGRLGRVAEAVGRRMEAEGCSLSEAVAAEGRDLPDLYAAVIEAGARAGRLPAALEGLTALARGRAELRRTIDLALLYPAIVAAMAYGLFVAFVVLLAPRMDQAFRALGVPSGAASLLARAGESAAIWGPIGLGLFAVAVLLRLRSGRASALGDRGREGALLPVPGIRGIRDLARSGMFAELLALLIENRVPMPDALRLSARAVGGPALRSAADHAADAIARGGDLRDALPAGRAAGLPPMLRWLILSGSAGGDLPRALRVAARSYCERAAFRAEVLRFALPTLLLVGIGGATVLIYGLALFVPFAELLRGLA